EAEVGLPAGLVEPLGGHVGGLRAIAGLHRRRAGARRALPRFKLALAILEATSALDRARGRIARPGTGWLGCVHAAYSCNGIANALRAAGGGGAVVQPRPRFEHGSGARLLHDAVDRADGADRGLGGRSGL